MEAVAPASVKRVMLDDLAREAGVSRSTASRGSFWTTNKLTQLVRPMREPPSSVAGLA